MIWRIEHTRPDQTQALRVLGCASMHGVVALLFSVFAVVAWVRFGLRESCSPKGCRG